LANFLSVPVQFAAANSVSVVSLFFLPSMLLMLQLFSLFIVFNKLWISYAIKPRALERYLKRFPLVRVKFHGIAAANSASSEVWFHSTRNCFKFALRRVRDSKRFHVEIWRRR